ncbi:hypothetical protein F300043A5_04330 [Massilimicrobiota timonensis]|uniref:metallophosphoesterase family protein n=1 Tax=Massilimicrobiota timonensis TaxID=1776392 RepID=UPI0036F1B182
MSRIFITGDTHGSYDMTKLSRRHFQEGKTLTKNDYVIICGDFGCVWGGELEKSDKWWQNWLDDQPWTTLWIDGNHENHDLLQTYPIEQWHGGRIHKINNSIYHLMRGEVFTINDKTIFTFGGGYSTDRAYRKEGVSWWKGELPTHEEVNYALQSLEKYNNHVDIILTHDAPRDIKEYLGFYNLCDMSVYGEEYEDIHSTLYFFKKNIVFQDWYLGHYHIDKDIGNMHILYNEIIEITDKE